MTAQIPASCSLLLEQVKEVTEDEWMDKCKGNPRLIKLTPTQA